MDLFDKRCKCEACSTSPAPTYTRAWMAECEIRWIAALPSHDARRTYLKDVEKHRGKASADGVRAAVWRLMK